MDIENWIFFNYPLNRHPFGAKGDTGCASPLCVRVSKPVEGNQVAHKEKPSRRKRKFNSSKSTNKSSICARFVSKACTLFLFADCSTFFLMMRWCIYLYVSIIHQAAAFFTGQLRKLRKLFEISPSCCEWGCNGTIRQWWCWFLMCPVGGLSFIFSEPF